jgi:hypothetical protein
MLVINQLLSSVSGVSLSFKTNATTWASLPVGIPENNKIARTKKVRQRTIWYNKASRDDGLWDSFFRPLKRA